MPDLAVTVPETVMSMLLTRLCAGSSARTESEVPMRSRLDCLAQWCASAAWSLAAGAEEDINEDDDEGDDEDNEDLDDDFDDDDFLDDDEDDDDLDDDEDDDELSDEDEIDLHIGRM